MKYRKEVIEVRPVMVRVFCEKDGEELEASGYSYATHPPTYPHSCPKCNDRVSLDAEYPRLEYK